ncbi:MAG: 4-(cytidine 5'-diphospho)-2-C-methyl-D-erythritol kinase [Bacteroidales bacterium]
MIIYSRAKINLGLQVIKKRTDGFHELCTIFYPVKLSDRIEMTPSDTFSYKDEGLKVDCPIDNNLVYKAYRILSDKYEIPHSVSVTMEKFIPFGAGLGGGSSNASAVLRGMNDMFNLNIPDTELYDYALKLGSDCPFFILSKPCIARGRGELLSPIELDLSDYQFVIVKPPDAVSTAEAYGGVSPQEPPVSLQEIIKLPVDEWRDLLKNDFEKHVFKLKPNIEHAKKRLYELGALYSSMSGSGAAVYGIFKRTSSLDFGSYFPPSYFVWDEH